MSSPLHRNAFEDLEPTLPSSWYLEDRYYTLEKEHIFFRDWICVGHEEQLPRPGGCLRGAVWLLSDCDQELAWDCYAKLFNTPGV
jgi:hypothetical protein